MRQQFSVSVQKIHFKDGIAVVENCEDNCQTYWINDILKLGVLHKKKKKRDEEEAIERTLSKSVKSLFTVFVIINKH